MARRKTSESQPTSVESFEDSLTELQTIVTELEDGSLELEASLARFERGVNLLRQCFQRLGSVQQRIELFLNEPHSGSGQLPSSTEFQNADGKMSPLVPTGAVSLGETDFGQSTSSSASILEADSSDRLF